MKIHYYFSTLENNLPGINSQVADIEEEIVEEEIVEYEESNSNEGQVNTPPLEFNDPVEENNDEIVDDDSMPELEDEY